MSTHSLAKFYTVIVGLVVFALVLSGCGAAATPAPQAPAAHTSTGQRR